jgi:hypothetical protein
MRRAPAQRLQSVKHARPEPVVLVCSVPADTDLAALEIVLRLQLTAKRLGARLVVRGGQELLHLTGLSEVLGQPEAREKGGVQEVVDMRDPPGGDLHDLNGPGRVAALGIDAVLPEAGAAVDGDRHQP